ncbi:MAG TPA: hypothetical protein VF746_16825 [Longimicrobium sp.]|jgi:hypothetical protein
MPKNLTTSVRILFASFVLTLLAYAGLDTALTRSYAEAGLSTCGDAANPCQLAPLTVTAPRPGARLVQAPVTPSVEQVPLAES